MPIQCLRGVAVLSSFPKGLVSISVFRTFAFPKRSIYFATLLRFLPWLHLFALSRLRDGSPTTRQPRILKRSSQRDNMAERERHVAAACTECSTNCQTDTTTPTVGGSCPRRDFISVRQPHKTSPTERRPRTTRKKLSEFQRQTLPMTLSLRGVRRVFCPTESISGEIDGKLEEKARPATNNFFTPKLERVFRFDKTWIH